MGENSTDQSRAETILAISVALRLQIYVSISKRNQNK